MPETCNLSYVECEQRVGPLILSISRTTYLENYSYLWEDEGRSYLQRFYSEEGLLSDLQNPMVSLYLIYLDDIAVGFFKLKRLDSPELNGSSMMIDKLYLLKAFTGKQIGKQVLTHIEELACVEGYKQVSLQVMDSSPAKFFYLKNGYIQTGEDSLGYPYMKKAYNVILTLEKKIV
jgi:GNAT superfamily N-acetyltransferase